jgi:hypothetical protein
MIAAESDYYVPFTVGVRHAGAAETGNGTLWDTLGQYLKKPVAYGRTQLQTTSKNPRIWDKLRQNGT